MAKTGLLIIAIVFGFFQQQNPIESFNEIPVHASTFEIDHFGNIYLVNQSRLIKLDPNGTKLYEYSNPLLGNIRSLDVSDPLRLLVFYSESNQIQFLNNALAEIASPIELDNHDRLSVKLACNSTMNRIWLFDNDTRKLVQYDQHMDMVQQSVSVDQIITTDSIPDILFETNGRLYLNCPDYGVVVFDEFGSFSNKFNQPGIKSFQVEGNLYYYLIKSGFYQYSKDNMQENKLPVSTTPGVRNIKYYRGKHYVLESDTLKIFHAP